MALCVSQSRNGQTLKVQWTWFQLGIMLTPDKFPGLKEHCTYTVEADEVFTTTEDAVFTDGEPGVPFTWEIKKGDVLEMWRDR